MASQNIKIHEHSRVSPPSATPQKSLPLTFFDLFWLRFHPVERIFFYTLPTPQSNPSIFYSQIVPKLKTSLSHTLQHFPPLAGNVVWPNDSANPIVQYTPGDAVSLVVAESVPGFDFNHVLDNSPRQASDSRCLVPHLDSSDSHASILSIQITLFPNTGFSIGISTHHSVLDGKSSTLFIKAWVSLCKTSDDHSSESSPFLPPKLVPFFDRSVIKSPSELGFRSPTNWSEVLTKLFPNENSDGRCLKLLPFPPRLEDHVRATFALTGPDLEKLKKRVLSNWDIVEKGTLDSTKPPRLSSFVVTCAYALVCIAKAIHGVEKEKDKFAFGFTVDCRARLDPPIPDNYFGNCVWGSLVDAEPLDFIKEEGFVIAAKSIQRKIKEISEMGIFHGAGDVMSKYQSLAKEKVEMLGTAGSNRFGVYESDFGWGKPAKVEITSVDRSITIGLAESRDGDGGVEVGIVLKKHAMDLFATLFRQGVSDQ